MNKRSAASIKADAGGTPAKDVPADDAPADDGDADGAEASVSANRVLNYLSSTDRIDNESVQGRHLKSLIGDSRAINDHCNFVAENLNFLLDASLGMISLQQNRVMKIFSVVAVVLMPPTLIAGIYGMNFKHMPELEVYWGYLWAIGVMLASAIIPYWIARRKGWL